MLLMLSTRLQIFVDLAGGFLDGEGGSAGWLDKMPTFDSFDGLDAARLTDGLSSLHSHYCVQNGCLDSISLKLGTRTGRKRIGRSSYRS